MATVFVDGRFVERDEARVSAFDAGFQHGVGLFETMLALKGPGGLHVLHLHEHLERLKRSARELGLSQSLHLPALHEAVLRTVNKAGEQHPALSRLRVRLTITGGDLNLLGRGGTGYEAHLPGLVIVAQPATTYPAEMYAKGVLATLADLKANPLDPMQGHKTLNYWGRLRELQEAGRKGAAEAVVLSVTNHLAGGCVSNLFLVKDGVLLTPIARGEEEDVAGGDVLGIEDEDAPPSGARSGGGALPSPVLPGVVRRWVMDWALAEGVECRRQMLSVQDLLGAHEALLTNSSWGVLPVTRIETKEVGTGKVGGVGERLVEAWEALTTGEAREGEADAG